MESGFSCPSHQHCGRHPHLPQLPSRPAAAPFPAGTSVTLAVPGTHMRSPTLGPAAALVSSRIPSYGVTGPLPWSGRAEHGDGGEGGSLVAPQLSVQECCKSPTWEHTLVASADSREVMSDPPPPPRTWDPDDKGPGDHHSGLGWFTVCFPTEKLLAPVTLKVSGHYLDPGPEAGPYCRPQCVGQARLPPCRRGAGLATPKAHHCLGPHHCPAPQSAGEGPCSLSFGFPGPSLVPL